MFLIDPVNVTNYTAGISELSCLASGIPLPTISWLKDNVVLVTSERITINTTASITQNERNITSTLTIAGLLLSDTGMYQCTTSNTRANDASLFRDISKAAYVFVHCKLRKIVPPYYSLIDPPRVTLTPSLTVINQTNTTLFTCELFGIPTPTVTWSKTQNRNRVILMEPGTDPNITTTVNGYNVTSVLLFNSSLHTDEGNYTCKGVNDVVNIIDSPELDTTTLFVQGELSCNLVIK